ncbi:Gfo/Idh/MocA family oxidoreductase [Sphingobacterium sp. SRCM116780]|uniref:Gfo/Idh/MocA family oxidoreductase n=1 Tax=Sphingobacterium sp. SRCM116780 TaxID=2907623 RepID=UPI001F2DDB06|nr:Gfo/Idh/MocA family oxidoreductase [Sphingobacterium sp. SRCM116780]UIR56011.1 Gfo/Idh/MocA family oxidoreductase [Sphingobacterium sp. SRCM116780]
MKKVITYGTYDLLHHGHLNLLKNAKALGDYLIVGVTSDSFDMERGKLNVHHNVLKRVQAIKDTGLADEIIIEDYIGQKIHDIQRFHVDIFAIGSDWEGHFDYLNEFCQVIYLPRTEGVSSTMIRDESQIIFKMGIIGSGRIAHRFVPEAAFVNGVEVISVFNPDVLQAKDFKECYQLKSYHQDFDDFTQEIDAVYIASPHISHYDYIKRSLLAGKHVLCEIPLTLKKQEAEEVYKLAQEKELVLLEASKTAFCPAFLHLISLVKSGVIGEIVDVQASLSKLQDKTLREFDPNQAGGSVTELAPLPLLVILKILGKDIKSMHFYSVIANGIDTFTKGLFAFEHSIATITLGLGVKTEGNLVISGTKGYVYVPAPWWKTDFFELRFEDQNLNRKFFYPYAGEGLRYEIQEFFSMIVDKSTISFKLKPDESILIAEIIENFRAGEHVNIISRS